MCSLGDLVKNEVTHEPIEGYRGWHVKIKDNDGLLYPLYKKNFGPFNKERISQANITGPLIETEEGFYSYNYYNYYNNYYNYYNYDYHNNNNYYHNNNNYYHNNNNCYNYYYIVGKILLTGDIAHHELGYRATQAQPTLLVKLTPKKGPPKEFQTFLEHFNSLIEETAKNYNIPVIDHLNFK